MHQPGALPHSAACVPLHQMCWPVWLCVPHDLLHACPFACMPPGQACLKCVQASPEVGHQEVTCAGAFWKPAPVTICTYEHSGMHICVPIKLSTKTSPCDYLHKCMVAHMPLHQSSWPKCTDVHSCLHAKSDTLAVVMAVSLTHGQRQASKMPVLPKQTIQHGAEAQSMSTYNGNTASQASFVKSGYTVGRSCRCNHARDHHPCSQSSGRHCCLVTLYGYRTVTLQVMAFTL